MGSIKIEVLSAEDRQLYAALVYGMARDIFVPYTASIAGGRIEKGPRDPAAGKSGQIIGTHHLSTSEIAFTVLAKFPGLQAMYYLPEKRSVPVLSQLKLTVDLEHLEDTILSDFPSEVPKPDDVLAAFVGLMAHCGALPTTRDTFAAPAGYLDICDRLAAAGYMGRLGDRFRWLDKAAPAMRASYLWGADHTSHADNFEDELELMWRTMPQEFKTKVFFSGDVDIGAFAIAYSKCWLKDRWDMSQRPDPNAGGVTLSGGGIGVCKQLVERFVKPLRPGIK